MGSENFQKIMLLHPRNRYGTYSEHCRTLPTASNIKKRDSIIVIHRSWNQYKAQEQCVPHSSPRRLAGEEKKVPAIIIKQQFGFPMSTT